MDRSGDFGTEEYNSRTDSTAEVERRGDSTIGQGQIPMPKRTEGEIPIHNKKGYRDRFYLEVDRMGQQGIFHHGIKDRLRCRKGQKGIFHYRTGYRTDSTAKWTEGEISLQVRT